MPAGRPSKYSQEIADKICALIAENSRMSMKAISQMDGMPCVATMFKWLREHESFSEAYARAKQEQADLLVDEMISISDDGRTDVDIRVGKDGKEYEVVRNDVVQRSKLMVDTRKWIAAKLKPKKYGDRIEQHHTGDGTVFSGLTIKAPGGNNK